MTRQRGFSILEMLVVTLVALIIFGVGLTLLNGVSAVRAQATTRVLQSESSRLFFDLLEKDLAAAYPGPHPIGQQMYRGRGNYGAAPQPIVLMDTDGGVTYDILQFYTRNDDPQAESDEYVFVRYFVNHVSHMACRQVFRKYATDPEFPPDTAIDPTGLTFIDGNADARVLQGALFDGAYSFQVSFRRWDPNSKTMNTSPGASASHIQVDLFMQPLSKDGTIRSFSKIVELPVAIK